MKKTLSTIAVTAFVVLSTAAFSFAEYTSTGGSNFPFFHLGCLIVGGLLIISLKKKFSKLYVREAVGAFAVYTVMVSLFTSPVIEAVRSLVG